MKKSLILVAALLSITLLEAQEIKFGAKAGLNLSTMSITIPQIQVNGVSAVGENQDNGYAAGFHVGGLAEIYLSDTFFFQPELLFSTQGSSYKSNDVLVQNINGLLTTTTSDIKTTLNLSYITLPLLAKYYATEELFFIVGPQLGYLLVANSKSEGSATATTSFAGQQFTATSNVDPSTRDVKSSFNELNVSLNIGGGYFFTENIFAEARYNYGLSKDLKDTGYDVKSQASTIQLSLGYRF